MALASDCNAGKPLAVLLRNGCGPSFSAFKKSLEQYFHVSVPDDGLHDCAVPGELIVHTVEQSLKLSPPPQLLITNSRGIVYLRRALTSASAPCCKATILMLSCGSPHAGPLCLQDHPGRVVCLHGHYDSCTDASSLNEALQNRNNEEPAVLFEIMNRGHRKGHGWHLGGLARWALSGSIIGSSHDKIYFPPDTKRFPDEQWPDGAEDGWKEWRRKTYQSDPSAEKRPETNQPELEETSKAARRDEHERRKINAEVCQAPQDEMNKCRSQV